MNDRVSKFIAKLTQKEKVALSLALEKIKIGNWSTLDIKKLVGNKNLYRVRIGKIRIIFKKTDYDPIIVDIDYRGNIY